MYHPTFNIILISPVFKYFLNYIESISKYCEIESDSLNFEKIENMFIRHSLNFDQRCKT